MEKKRQRYERLAAFLLKMACNREACGDRAASERFLEEAAEMERMAAAATV